MAAIFVLIAACIYPLVEGERTKAILAKLRDGADPERIRVYWGLITFSWAIGVPIVVIWIYQDYSFSLLGLSNENSWSFWVGLAAVTAIVLYYLSVCLRLRRSPELRKQMLQSIGDDETGKLIPRSIKELRLWVLCSISASWEEIIYRGFALWYLAQFTNIILASVMSCALFALAHSYQGVAGIIRTGIYGTVLVLVYIGSGSLWLAILLHITQDMFAGIAGYLSYTLRGDEN
tara:strand:- start:2827 stop:3525 length:699 start_codon:yes stop_codon:yes gene_type:complete